MLEDIEKFKEEKITFIAKLEDSKQLFTNEYKLKMVKNFFKSITYPEMKFTNYFRSCENETFKYIVSKYRTCKNIEELFNSSSEKQLEFNTQKGEKVESFLYSYIDNACEINENLSICDNISEHYLKKKYITIKLKYSKGIRIYALKNLATGDISIVLLDPFHLLYPDNRNEKKCEKLFNKHKDGKVCLSQIINQKGGSF